MPGRRYRCPGSTTSTPSSTPGSRGRRWAMRWSMCCSATSSRRAGCRSRSRPARRHAGVRAPSRSQWRRQLPRGSAHRVPVVRHGGSRAAVPVRLRARLRRRHHHGGTTRPATPAQPAAVDVDLANESDRDGVQVVQVYAGAGSRRLSRARASVAATNLCSSSSGSPRSESRHTALPRSRCTSTHGRCTRGASPTTTGCAPTAPSSCESARRRATLPYDCPLWKL